MVSEMRFDYSRKHPCMALGPHEGLLPLPRHRTQWHNKYMTDASKLACAGESLPHCETDVDGRAADDDADVLLISVLSGAAWPMFAIIFGEFTVRPATEKG